jgi:hypothetical protein
MTNRILWSLVELAARGLDADERNYVRGDLEESGATASESLSAILGLVMRRSLITCSDWRNWPRVAALIIPLSVVLSIISRRTADWSAIYFWLYVNNWHLSFINTAEFWSVLAESAWGISIGFLTLACFSWTGGFVLGAASRRTVLMNGFLFCSMLALGALLIAPQYLHYWQAVLMQRYPPRPDGHPYHDTDAVFAFTFYRAVFPLILQAILVLIPAIWGMRRGRRFAGSHLLFNLMIWTGVGATVLVMLLEVPGLGLVVWTHAGARAVNVLAHLVRGLRFLVYWPLAYLIVSAIWRFRSQRLVAA